MPLKDYLYLRGLTRINNYGKWVKKPEFSCSVSSRRLYLCFFIG
jgi:hypothetical protein